MDAVTFVNEYLRMCSNFSNCEKCPILKTYFCTINAKEEKARIDEGEVVRIVEEWSAAHPRKTRQSVFLEQYPQGDIDNTGLLMLCPKRISADIRVTVDCLRKRCSDCRREFWLQEVK